MISCGSFLSVATSAFRSLFETCEKNSSSLTSARTASFWNKCLTGGGELHILVSPVAPASVRLTSFFRSSRSISFETAPRVRPQEEASRLGAVSPAAHTSRRITHSATVTPLPASLRAKPCET